MMEYGELSREEKDANGVDACKPSINAISAKRFREERGKKREKDVQKEKQMQ